VKKVLEAMAEVASAEVSHETGTAIVTLNSAVADDVLKSTVEAQGYDVTGIC
jgi:Cu2+-exporting ATPase